MKLLRTFISLAAIYAACVLAVMFVFSPGDFVAPGVVAGSLLSTAAGGAATAFSWNMTYIPEFFSYTAATQLTSLRIETQEDGVLHDWVTASLNAMANFMKVGAQTANTYWFRLSNGELKRSNVTISGVTAAAGAVPFFGCSDNKGTAAFKSSNATIIGLNVTRFENFTALFIPTMATSTDYCNVLYDDGHLQTYAMEDLRNLSSAYQQTEGVILNNTEGRIKYADFRTAANTAAYMLSVKTS